MPKFEPGHPSKGGRPLGHRNYLRKLIGENGEKAFNIIWEIAQGKRKSKKWMSQEGGPVEVEQLPSIKEQMDAAACLAEHLSGKPVQQMDVDATGTINFVLKTNVED